MDTVIGPWNFLVIAAPATAFQSISYDSHSASESIFHLPLNQTFLMDRQPIEILLLFSGFLSNRQALRLFRLNFSSWRAHQSADGRYRLKPPDKGYKTLGFRPSQIFPRGALKGSAEENRPVKEIRSLPLGGNYLIDAIFLDCGKDIDIFFHRWSEEFLSSIRIVALYNNTPLKIPFPPSVKAITFGWRFDQILSNNILPQTVERLDYSGAEYFLGPFGKDFFPPSVKFLYLPEPYQEAFPVLLKDFPVGIEQIHYNNLNGHCIDLNEFPQGLKEIYFHGENYLLNSPGKFPESLKILHLANEESLEGIEFPESLEELRLENNPSLPDRFPSQLKTLLLSREIYQPISPGILPNTLKRLQLGEKFSQSLEGIFPEGLEYLSYYDQEMRNFFHDSHGNFLGQPFFPSSLKELKIFHFQWSIPQKSSLHLFPPSLRVLYLSSQYDCPFRDSSQLYFPMGCEEISLDFYQLSPEERKKWKKYPKRNKGNSNLPHHHHHHQQQEETEEEKEKEKDRMKFQFPLGCFPSSLRKLFLSSKIHPEAIFPIGILPESLEILLYQPDMYCSYLIPPFPPGIFPRSLKTLQMPLTYQMPIVEGLLPDSLQEFRLSDSYRGFFPLSALPKQFHGLMENFEDFQFSAHERFQIGKKRKNRGKNEEEEEGMEEQEEEEFFDEEDDEEEDEEKTNDNLWSIPRWNPRFHSGIPSSSRFGLRNSSIFPMNTEGKWCRQEFFIADWIEEKTGKPNGNDGKRKEEGDFLYDFHHPFLVNRNFLLRKPEFEKEEIPENQQKESKFWNNPPQ